MALGTPCSVGRGFSSWKPGMFPLTGQGFKHCFFIISLLYSPPSPQPRPQLRPHHPLDPQPPGSSPVGPHVFLHPEVTSCPPLLAKALPRLPSPLRLIIGELTRLCRST